MKRNIANSKTLKFILFFVILLVTKGQTQVLSDVSVQASSPDTVINVVVGEYDLDINLHCDEESWRLEDIFVFSEGIALGLLQSGDINLPCTFPLDQVIAVEDMNFDGYADFRLMEFLPAGPNTPFIYFIFDAKTETFKQAEAYASITSPEFDQETQKIYSFWRDGCCRHGTDSYHFQEGVPVLVERIVIGHDDKDREYFEQWKLVEGSLIMVRKEIDDQ